jgi:(2R)-ethylmalonyl-CoA mutase
MPTEKPWLFRTYAGHSTAAASNALYRTNLAKGQTGLSVAFDLPTQTGYDSDDPRAVGEVGKVGVPVSHLGDMRMLFKDIPLDQMNTSMTINATAPWLLALYVAVAEEQGADTRALQGTVQNDIIKEYLSRGTYICPPKPSLRLITDVAAWTGQHLPKWNPMNVCSYHLQEAGATPEQELAFALATAVAVLDDLRGKVPAADFPAMAARISFFVNAGIRFVTEMCKMRAFTDLWDEILLNRYGTDEERTAASAMACRSTALGLTEQQPENNVYRILLEMLAVTLSKKARARAVQLPAWNEALGLPRPWDQQWSLRMQQILAYETDLLEYDDLFDGNPAIDRKVAGAEGRRARRTGADRRHGRRRRGHRLHEIATGRGQRRPHRPDRIRRNHRRRREPLHHHGTLAADHRRGGDHAGRPGGRGRPDRPPGRLACRPRSGRQGRARRPARGRRSGANIMPASDRRRKGRRHHRRMGRMIRAAFGEYRGPTGVSKNPSNRTEGLEPIREAVAAVSTRLGRRLKFLWASPALTAIPTAPSRSPPAPAIAAWTSTTKASA